MSEPREGLVVGADAPVARTKGHARAGRKNRKAILILLQRAWFRLGIVVGYPLVELRADARHRQLVSQHVTLLAMDDQFETIGEKILQHGPKCLVSCPRRNVGVEVAAYAVDPVGAGVFVQLQIVCRRQHPKDGAVMTMISAGIVSSWTTACIGLHAPWTQRCRGLDRGHFKDGFRRLPRRGRTEHSKHGDKRKPTPHAEKSSTRATARQSAARPAVSG